jgi:hypothetical protein
MATYIASIGKIFRQRTTMERFLRRDTSASGTADGREVLRKWVCRLGMSVGRRRNQNAERAVRRGPFEGIPLGY